MPPTLRCDPKLFEKDLTDQIFVVTGANSGCGLETTRQLVKQGGTVILACRNEERGQVAAKETNGIFLTTLDLASLQSIRDFVDAFKEKYDRLDGLVNNAGKGKINTQNDSDRFFFWLFGLACGRFVYHLDRIDN